MPLALGILDVLEAIPRRIEMSGQEPTWRITGASFDEVCAFARDAVPHDAVVVARVGHHRWWPRVTLTFSVDPALTADAPPVEKLRHPPVVLPEQREPAEVPLWNDEEYAESFSPIEELFAHQEEVRVAREQVPDLPDQRGRGPGHRADPE